MRVKVPAALTALVVLLLAAPTLAAEGEIKRAANGKPDLTGTYDAATLTPLQRPEEYGENLLLTRDEAEKIAADAAKARAERHQVSDPDREAPPEGGDGSPGAAGNVGGYNSFWLDRGTDTFAVDGKFRTSIIIDPPNGRMPETTEAAKARFAERAKLRRPNEGVAWWLRRPRVAGDQRTLRPRLHRRHADLPERLQQLQAANSTARALTTAPSRWRSANAASSASPAPRRPSRAATTTTSGWCRPRTTS